MRAEDYCLQEITAGRLTMSHIVELVEHFQDSYDIPIDGKPGPVTRAKIDKILDSKPGQLIGRARVITLSDVPRTPTLLWPLPTLKDGRRPVITSEYRPKDRPTHNGLDLFYRWAEGDIPNFVGDGGAEGSKGKPKWVVPYGTSAYAAAAGKVMMAGNSPTGYRLWVDHGNGWRTGYFHLSWLAVVTGDVVQAGDRLGIVGNSPRGVDGNHLHFELSPVDRYAPVDPTPFLVAKEKGPESKDPEPSRQRELPF